jgi:hypothetical protein
MAQRDGNPSMENVKCKAFKHAGLDGPTFLEKRKDRQVWVAYLECPSCGTKRTDTMVPETCELIHREYEHPPGYDTKLTAAEAKKIYFKSKLIKKPRPKSAPTAKAVPKRRTPAGPSSK